MVELGRRVTGQRWGSGPVLLEADEDRAEERQERTTEQDERGGRRDQPPAAYSASVCAWSHQPSTVRSDGGSTFSSSAARATRLPNSSRSTSRMSRKPSK